MLLYNFLRAYISVDRKSAFSPLIDVDTMYLAFVGVLKVKVNVDLYSA